MQQHPPLQADESSCLVFRYSYHITISASLTDTAFSPNPVQVSVGSTVTWTNDDAQPHTVNSGENATPDGTFDSGILAPAARFEYTFTEAGEYPYFCLLHPNMVGTVSVSE